MILLVTTPAYKSRWQRGSICDKSMTDSHVHAKLINKSAVELEHLKALMRWIISRSACCCNRWSFN